MSERSYCDFFLYRTLTFFVCELYSICGQVIDSGEEGGLFRIGVATLTGVLAFLVLEKVSDFQKNSSLTLCLPGARDEQPGDK